MQDNDVMTTIFAYDVMPEIRLRQSMLLHIHSRYNRAKFHPDRIWNDGTLGFFSERSPQQEDDDA